MPPQPRWEYRILDCYALNEYDRVERANVFGKAGWELVAIDRGDSWIFKRAVLAEEPVVVVMTPPPALERNSHARQPAPPPSGRPRRGR